MQVIASQATVKVVGANGQISLGKQFAGRQVLIEEQEAGVWLIRTATVIPDNERWLHEAHTASDNLLAANHPGPPLHCVSRRRFHSVFDRSPRP